MSRIAHCAACTMELAGVKTRIALEHTCGIEHVLKIGGNSWWRGILAKMKLEQPKGEEIDENGFFYTNAGRYWFCRKWGAEVWLFTLIEGRKWCSMRQATQTDIAKARKTQVSDETDKALRRMLPYNDAKRNI